MTGTEKTRVVNLKHEECDVHIHRPTRWGNPYHIGRDGSREEVIRKYEEHLRGNIHLLTQVHEIQGKRLGCWCKPKPCHGDVLARYADNPRLVEEAIARLKNGKEERAGVSED